MNDDSARAIRAFAVESSSRSPASLFVAESTSDSAYAARRSKSSPARFVSIPSIHFHLDMAIAAGLPGKSRQGKPTRVPDIRRIEIRLNR
ncbi:MAG TPA: hypothetical protein VMN78_08915 [Longimicrobiales bacterium]|nr:hypothetical protein [Longimicrobiales bacterium]